MNDSDQPSSGAGKSSSSSEDEGARGDGTASSRWSEKSVESLDRGPRSQQAGSSVFSPLSSLFSEFVSILTRPKDYFAGRARKDDWTRALAWGGGVHWVGALVSFLWGRLLFPGQLKKTLELYSEQLGLGDAADLAMLSGVVEASLVIADPFLTVISVLMVSTLVWFGARLMVSPEAQYGDAVKVVSYGLVGYAFQVVPFVGGFAAWVYAIVLSVFAARAIFGVETSRGILLVFFPKILSFAMMLILALMVAIPLLISFGMVG